MFTQQINFFVDYSILEPLQQYFKIKNKAKKTQLPNCNFILFPIFHLSKNLIPNMILQFHFIKTVFFSFNQMDFQKGKNEKWKLFSKNKIENEN